MTRVRRLRFDRPSIPSPGAEYSRENEAQFRSIVDRALQDAAGQDTTANDDVYEPSGAVDEAVATHNADTTGVHGIANTALLETTAGAQAKADAAIVNHVAEGTAAHPLYLPKTGGVVAGHLQVDDYVYVGTNQLPEFVGVFVRGWTHNPTDGDKASEHLVSYRSDDGSYGFAQYAFARERLKIEAELSVGEVLGEARTFDWLGSLYMDGSGTSVSDRTFGFYDQVRAAVPFWIGADGRVHADEGLEASVVHVEGDVTVDGDLEVLGDLIATIPPIQSNGTEIGLGGVPVSGYRVNSRGRMLLLPPALGAAPRLALALYGDTDDDVDERVRFSIATAPDDGITGTEIGDPYVTVATGAKLAVKPVFLGEDGTVGVNVPSPGPTLFVQSASAFQPAVWIKPAASQATDILAVESTTGGYLLRIRENHHIEILRNSSVCLGDLVDNLAPGSEYGVGMKNSTDPSAAPIGGAFVHAASGHLRTHNSDGSVIDLAPIAAIADATDPIDVVTKFNTLLAELRANGYLAT